MPAPTAVVHDGEDGARELVSDAGEGADDHVDVVEGLEGAVADDDCDVCGWAKIGRGEGTREEFGVDAEADEDQLFGREAETGKVAAHDRVVGGHEVGGAEDAAGDD